MKINSLIKKQWGQLCKNKFHSDLYFEYKIKRAIELGQVTYIYENGCRIVRYYDLNFLIDPKLDEVLTLWRDVSTQPVDISYGLKKAHYQHFISQQKEIYQHGFI